MQTFRSFHTAERTIESIEAAHMMRKGQLKRISGKDVVGHGGSSRASSRSLHKTGAISQPSLSHSNFCWRQKSCLSTVMMCLPPCWI